MKKISLLLVVILLLSGCTATQNHTSITQSPSLSEENIATKAMLAPFEDVRGGLFTADKRVLTPNEYKAEDMYTYEFNENTVFTGNETLQQEIIENGKNPGLGVRALHERGITGEGVSVAIIDQELILEPSEFSDRIVEYYECSGYDFEGRGSMHGPAVVSILAGKTTGVAPGAKVYYAAASSRYADSAYYADGLNWIVDKNETLPENEKIRLVSISTSLSGVESSYTNQELWDEVVERAQAAGILVMDCRTGVDTGFIEHGFYDYNDPDNIEKARNGWSELAQTSPTPEGCISVPCDYRTTVEQYETGNYFFRYGGSGGLSWGIPYAAGVLALGWQINPRLTAEEMKQLLIQSAYENEYGERIIYPAAFIELVDATL